ncbi:threonine/serine exporter family protein [uncultured Clostridium sp.]|uniref:threonine/serine ThrE exporter family protein n=1 Tax=uncultured Clostridium sp. TaxID=59620 RepID=UPI003216FA1C
MKAKQVLDIALSAGELLISNGSESYRVEETIERICKAYNYKSECITTGKGIFISILDEDQEKVTSLKKVRGKSVDLYSIELVNSFSRSIEEEKISYDEAMSRLNDIRKSPTFKLPIRVLAGGMTCFIYSLFFNGTIFAAFISAIIGMIIYYMVDKVSNVGFFQFFIFFFSGFLIASIGIFFENIITIVDKDKIILGSIMVLLPGVALTNGIKDIIYGDFTSGISKVGEAVLIITAIGSGIGTVLSFRNFLGIF